MSKRTDAIAGSPGEAAIPQYGLPMILFMFAWPLAWFSFLIYVIGPMLLTSDGFLPTWAVNTISLLGNAAELAVGLIILRREGYRLTLKALRDRINWRFPDTWRKWVAALVIFVVAVGLGTFTSQFSADLATVPGFIPPDWFPATMNPLKEVNSVQDAFPDVNLPGNYLFLFFQFGIVGLIFNMIGEELYYRGALQPKMRGVFGRWDWLANGVLFILKHSYFRWNFPAIWTAGPALAYVFGPLGSLPLAIIFHWMANDLLNLIGTIPVVFGAG